MILKIDVHGIISPARNKLKQRDLPLYLVQRSGVPSAQRGGKGNKSVKKQELGRYTKMDTVREITQIIPTKYKTRFLSSLNSSLPD